jgi:hemerythrin-like domain-containing protein
MPQTPAQTTHASIRIIHEEHASLAAMLRSSLMMVQRGPQDQPERFFDVMRAMLFYMDEFPERLHHTKESELLFPTVAARSKAAREVVGQLNQEHAVAESKVREMQHLLLAWELLGDSRRERFELALKAYVDFYLQHMHLEETVVIAQALQVLDDSDWRTLNSAFSIQGNPLTGKYPREPLYDRLFTRITMHAPAPIGLGPSSN